MALATPTLRSAFNAQGAASSLINDQCGMYSQRLYFEQIEQMERPAFFPLNAFDNPQCQSPTENPMGGAGGGGGGGSRRVVPVPVMHPKLVSSLKAVIASSSTSSSDQSPKAGGGWSEESSDERHGGGSGSRCSKRKRAMRTPQKDLAELYKYSVSPNHQRDAQQQMMAMVGGSMVDDEVEAKVVPMELIQNRRPFKCDYEGCHKTFKNPQTMKMHHKTHNTDGEEPYRAGGFGSGGGGLGPSWPQNMLTFKAGHNKKIASKCPKCFKTFVGLYELRRHVGRRHSQGEKRFACSKDGCDKKFYIDVDLRDHEKLCGAPIECKCGMKFAFKCNLVNHKKQKPACQDHFVGEDLPQFQQKQSLQQQRQQAFLGRFASSASSRSTSSFGSAASVLTAAAAPIGSGGELTASEQFSDGSDQLVWGGDWSPSLESSGCFLFNGDGGMSMSPDSSQHSVTINPPLTSLSSRCLSGLLSSF